MEMNGEIYNFIKVWIIALASGCYCYTLSKLTSKGFFRLTLVIPIIILFTILPFSMYSPYLGTSTYFFLVWFANFKLLLFSFDQGPLVPSIEISLTRFLFTLLLPIKSKQDPTPTRMEGPGLDSRRWVLFGVKLLALACVMECYRYMNGLPYVVLLALILSLFYVGLDLTFALCAVLGRAFLGIQLGPQFNQPLLTTTLQDFWGSRWNLMISDIMRQTIYKPTREYVEPLMGRKQATWVGVFMSFLVSGLMHELIFYHLTRVSPTWEVTLFFVLQGLCTTIELIVKDKVSNKWQLHRMISGPFIIGFVVFTSFWLFFPPLLRIKLFEKAIDDYLLMVDTLKMNVLYYLSH